MDRLAIFKKCSLFCCTILNCADKSFTWLSICFGVFFSKDNWWGEQRPMLKLCGLTGMRSTGVNYTFSGSNWICCSCLLVARLCFCLCWLTITLFSDWDTFRITSLFCYSWCLVGVLHLHSSRSIEIWKFHYTQECSLCLTKMYNQIIAIQSIYLLTKL